MKSRLIHHFYANLQLRITNEMETIVEEIVAVEDLKKNEQLYNAELAQGRVTVGTQFQYAWCLVRSRYRDDMRRGVVLLEELLHGGSPQVQRDCLFYLAIGYYRLKEYTNALKFVQGLLQIEPNNRQGADLEKLIKKKMNKDGLLGMAIVGGAAVALAGLVGAGIALAKK
ncbi:mitochondrial fission 1 protein-like isoform X2 [Lytechinus variegatus]|uniref:mitochondrial fission 1 protein-like isoform X2 n=1 Tax=Lytechinus variegatus TaxID=7654 RepID=UPI001BB1A566|nr:mitochondrial fission 1 protein-like isoform X2 [Lytechinus variegatus]